MSTNLTPEQKLRALLSINPVSAHPHPYGGAACALQRVQKLVNVPTGKGDLLTVGDTLGFTRSETIGVMWGWDRAAGKSRTDPSILYAPEDYDRGFELGKALFEEYGRSE